jgi:hypothetical protein
VRLGKKKFGITTIFSNKMILLFWGRVPGKKIIFIIRLFFHPIYYYSFKRANVGCCLPAAAASSCCCCRWYEYFAEKENNSLGRLISR